MAKELTLRGTDPISGKLGECYANIDGSMEDMLYVKKVEAKVEKQKKEINVLGYSGSKNKSAGWKGTGTATLYYMTSIFRKKMLEYMNTGKDFYVDMFIVNDDPSSNAGRQKIWLKNVNFDGITLAMLDVDNTELNEELSFTFDGAEMVEEFDTVTGE
ncbi:MAG: phage tail tube protein [Clostridia bacterium]|nr:phage tail tube protein [Clostridia bacterium]